MKSLTYAPDAWKLLDGFFCVYKPSKLSSILVLKTLAFNLCRDLNSMETRPPSKLVQLKGTVVSGKPFEVELVQNFADHELVVGPRYQKRDVRLSWLYRLGNNTSGVFVVAVNGGCKKIKNYEQRNFLRTYEVKGQFGLASSNCMADGNIREKSTYSHISLIAIERLLASIQASNQALAYRYSGVNLQSQEAYELASKGMIRPAGESDPLIYSIKCTELRLPHFTLEIKCINETEEYLAEIIYNLGFLLKSSAICTQLHQTHFGHFNLDHALLRKHWTLENILSNIALSTKILQPDNMCPSSPHFQPIKKSDLNQIMENMQEEIRKEHL